VHSCGFDLVSAALAEMSAVDSLVKAEVVPPAGTLGDLLYRNPTRSVVSEAAWNALVQAIVARDGQAMRTLYLQIHRLVFTLAMRITSQKAAAEEVTIDVFHEVWRRAAEYHPKDGTVVGWIVSIARSRAIDRVRYETRKKRVSTEKADPETSGPDFAVLALEQHQKAKLLHSALATLSPAERTAIECAYFSDATYAEVSQRLKEPLGTIKTRIRAGLVKLRHALSREGFP
jgi:RNA polymerase sigma-70 factor (ECF subfamily)